MRRPAGSYRFTGVDVGRLTRDQRALLRRHFIGFVFQGFNLLARTSALENVELPLIYAASAAPSAARSPWTRWPRSGLPDRERHDPNELSGGQQQRVAIARAIVTGPPSSSPTSRPATSTRHEAARSWTCSHASTATTASPS